MMGPMGVRRGRAAVSVTLVLVLGALVLLTLRAVEPGAQARRPPDADASSAGCGPPAAEDVGGRRPGYLPAGPSSFWSAGAVCEAMWLSGARGRFVPQGVAVEGDTAWVSGYQARTMRQRPCRVVQVDLRTMRVTRTQSLVEGAVPGREPTYCRHGGAVLADGPDRLLLVETMRLWLLDPRRLGTADALQRVWRIPDGVKGSVAVLTPEGELGLGAFSARGRGRIDWFDLDQLEEPGRSVLAPSRTERSRRGLQGLAWGRLGDRGAAGLWQTVSHTRCGALLGPQGQRIAVAPGVEGLDFEGDSVWMVSEASVRIYYDRGDPVVPQLLRYDRADLDATRGPRSRALARACL